MDKGEQVENIYVENVIRKMAETLTEEEIMEELNKIAQDRYGKEYHALCIDRQAIVRRLRAAGFPKL